MNRGVGTSAGRRPYRDDDFPHVLIVPGSIA